jgi:class III poly(R)-hydroxyalkanoic acid synthase PhaE subunit
VGEVTGFGWKGVFTMEKFDPESTFQSTQEYFDLWLKTYQATLGRLVEMPAMGPAREKQEKVMQVFSSFVNLQRVWMESNTDLQRVFTEAMRRVRERTGDEFEGEVSPERYKDFYKIWIETYSETFHEFMKSGHFAGDMGRFLSHYLDFQRLNREVMEESYLKPMNLPTKTEIDEINRELYSLRKSVKELRNEVHQLSGKH